MGAASSSAVQDSCLSSAVGRLSRSSAGSVASWASRASSSGSVNRPWTSTAGPCTWSASSVGVPAPGEHDSAVSPRRSAGTPRAVQRSTRRTSSERGTATSTRAVDSENSASNGVTPSRAQIGSSDTCTPTPNRRLDSTSAWARPPSDRSCAASTSSSRLARDEHLGQPALGGQVHGRRQPAEVAVHDVGPRRPVELGARGAQQVDGLAGSGPAGRRGVGDVVEHAQHADHRGRVDGGVDEARLARAVVERDVAAGDRDLEHLARVGQAADGLDQLPHRVGVLGAAEVEAVGDGQRAGARRRDVAVRLRQGQLRARVRVELGVAAVGVGGQRDAETGGLVDADHAGVVGLRERGVALHEAVVLVGHPRLGREVGAGQQLQDRGAELGVGRRLRAATPTVSALSASCHAGRAYGRS